MSSSSGLFDGGKTLAVFLEDRLSGLAKSLAKFPAAAARSATAEPEQVLQASLKLIELTPVSQDYREVFESDGRSGPTQHMLAELLFTWTGSEELLLYKPKALDLDQLHGRYTSYGRWDSAHPNTIHLEWRIHTDTSPEQVRSWMDSQREVLSRAIAQANKEAETYNETAKQAVRDGLQARRERLGRIEADRKALGLDQS